jgi:hypothetical protein
MASHGKNATMKIDLCYQQWCTAQPGCVSRYLSGPFNCSASPGMVTRTLKFNMLQAHAACFQYI